MPDDDADDDDVPDDIDNCPIVSNPDQEDGDGDGVGDVCDRCPTVPDPAQLDTDTDGRGDACQRNPRLTGAWPQSSSHRFMPWRDLSLPSAWRISTDVTPTDLFAPAVCDRSDDLDACPGSCGLSYVPDQTQLGLNDLITVAIASDDMGHAWIGLTTEGEPFAATITALDTTGGVLAEGATGTLSPTALAATLPEHPNGPRTATGVALLDLLHLEVDDGSGGRAPVLGALVRLFYTAGGVAFDHPLLVGLDPDDYGLRWVVALPDGAYLVAPTSFNDGVSARVFVTSDQRVLFHHASKSYPTATSIDPNESRDAAIFEAPVPADDPGVAVIATVAPDVVHETPPIDVALDDVGRLYVYSKGAEGGDVPGCAFAPSLGSRFVRVFSPTWQLLAEAPLTVGIHETPRSPFSNYGRTVFDNNVKGRTREGELRLERAEDAQGQTFYRLYALGEEPTSADPACRDRALGYGYSASAVDLDGTDPTACPADLFTRYCCDEHPNATGAATACADAPPDEGECVCKGCSGLLDVTGCGDFPYAAKSYAVEVRTFRNAGDGLVEDADGHRVIPIERTYYYGARRQGALVRDETTFVPDGHGSFLLGTYTCSNPGGPSSICGRLELYDLDNDPGRERVWQLVSFEDPRAAVGGVALTPADSPAPGFFATVQSHGLAGRLGAIDNVVSRTPVYTDGALPPIIGHQVFPLGDGRLLTLYDAWSDDAPRSLELRLLVADDSLVTGLSASDFETPMPRAEGCEEVEDCVQHPLEVVVESDDIYDIAPLQDATWFGTNDVWYECISYRLISGQPTTYDCSDPVMIAGWETQESEAGRTLWKQRYAPSGHPTNHFSTASGRTAEQRGVFIACDPDSVIRQVQEQTDGFGNVTRVDNRLRCARWTERYVPGRMRETSGDPTRNDAFDELALRPRRERAGCDDLARPALEVLYRVVGVPIVVTVSDTLGDANARLTADDTARLCHDNDGPVELTVTGGDGAFAPSDGDPDDDPKTVVVGEGECADLMTTMAGSVFVDARPIADNGSKGDPTPVTVLFEHPGKCQLDDADGEFLACAPPQPLALPSSEADQASFRNPAEAGIGVLLHDVSYHAEEVDLLVRGLGIDVSIGRSYHSARQPVQGGVLGGWTFHLDQRVVPVAPTGEGDDGVLPEDGATGYDLAFHDGTGRVDAWRHPLNVDGDPPEGVGTETVTYDATNGFWVLDPETDAVVAKLGPGDASWTAEVTTYARPRGRFETLRAYTITVPDGEVASAIHPYYDPEDLGVAANEQRFFELTSPDGTRRIFNCEGQLLRVIDPRFHELQLLYSGPVHPRLHVRQLSGLIDSRGRLWDVTWKAAGSGSARFPHLASVVDPFGREIAFYYASGGDGVARLSRVERRYTEPFGGQRDVLQTYAYGYDAEGRLTTVTLPGGGAPHLTITYDGLGRVTKQVVAEGGAQDDGPKVGGTWTFTGPIGNDVIVVDPRGDERTYVLEALTGDGPKVVEHVEWTKPIWDGQPKSPGATDEPLTRSWDYDADGLVTLITEPSGRMTSMAYNAKGSLTRQEVTPGAAGAGETKVWTYTYGDDCQELKTATSPGIAADTLLYMPFDHDRPGLHCQPVARSRPEVTDADGELHLWRTEIDYAESGPLRGVVTSRRTLDAPFLVRQVDVTHYELEGAFGETVHRKKTRPKVGLVKSRTFSGRIPDACTDNVPAEMVETYEVDERGNRVQEERARGGFESALVTTWTYDMKDRLVEKTVAPGSLNITEKRTWDSRDQLTKVEYARQDSFFGFFGGGISIPSQTQPSWDVVEHLYDRAGNRFATLTHGDSDDARIFELFAHDGRGNVITRVTPGSGAEASVMSDVFAAARAAKRASGVLDALPTPTEDGVREVGPPVVWEKTAYDADQQMIAKTLSDGLFEAGLDSADSLRAYRAERFFRNRDGDLVLWDTGRALSDGDEPPTLTPYVIENAYDGHRRLTESTTWDPAGCQSGSGGLTAVRRVIREGYTAFDEPTTRRVEGDDGAVAKNAEGALVGSGLGACSTGGTLREESFTFDEWGRIRTEAATRVALMTDGLVDDAPAAQTQNIAYGYRDGTEPVQIHDPGTGNTVDLDFTYADQLCAQRLRDRDNPEAGRTTTTLTLDGAGLVTKETVSDQGGGQTVSTSTTYTRDNAGRVKTETDALNQVIYREYDARGRVRVVMDLRETVYERAYDAVGNLISDVARNDDGTRGSFAAFNGTFRVAEQRFVLGAGATLDVIPESAVHGRSAVAYDGYGQVVRTWPYGRDAGQVEVKRFDPQGNLVQRTGLNEITFDYTVDAMGNPTVIEATTPWEDPDDAPRAYRGASVVSGESRVLRRNGLGHLTAAEDRRGAEAVATVLRWSDSRGATLQESTRFHDHPTAGREAVTTRVRVDARGRLVKRAFSDAPANDWSLEMSFDGLDHITAVTNPKAGTLDDGNLIPTFGSASFRWAGRYAYERTVVGAPFLGGDGAGNYTLTTSWSYDELAAPYYMKHTYDDGDGAQGVHASQQWFKGPDLLMSASTALKGGVRQVDPALLDIYLPLGVSHVSGFDPYSVPDRFKRLDDYTVYAGNPLSSTVIGTEYDGFGMAIRSMATTYGAQSGIATGTYTWTEYDGARRVRESSLTFKTDDGIFESSIKEMKSVEMTYANGADAEAKCGASSPIERVCHTRHMLLKEPIFLSEPSLPPEVGETSIAGKDVPVENRNNFVFSYTAGGRLTDGQNDRGEYGYDLFDRMISIADKLELGQNCNAGTCVASRRYVTWDPLERRVFETYDVPSTLPTERPRRFVYYGDDLVEEEVYRWTGETFENPGEIVYSGRSRFVYGATGNMVFAQPFEAGDSYLPLEGLDRRFVGFVRLSDGELQASSANLLLTRFKPQPFIGGPGDEAKVFRFTSPGEEQVPFDGLRFSGQGSYFKDFRHNPVNDQWYGLEAFSKAIEENRRGFDIIALVISFPVLAIAPFSVVAEGLSLLYDAVEITNEISANGLSWGSAFQIVASLGGAYLSYRGRFEYDVPAVLTLRTAKWRKALAAAEEAAFQDWVKAERADLFKKLGLKDHPIVEELGMKDVGAEWLEEGLTLQSKGGQYAADAEDALKQAELNLGRAADLRPQNIQRIAENVAFLEEALPQLEFRYGLQKAAELADEYRAAAKKLAEEWAQAATDLTETTRSGLGDAFQGGFARQAAQGPEAFAHNPWAAAYSGGEGWNFPWGGGAAPSAFTSPLRHAQDAMTQAARLVPTDPRAAQLAAEAAAFAQMNAPLSRAASEVAGDVTQVVTRGQAAAAAAEALTDSQDVLSTRFVSRP